MKGGSHHSVLAFLGLAFYFGFYLPSTRFYSEVKPFLLPLKCLRLERLSGCHESKQGLQKYAVAVVLFISCVFSHHVYPTQCWFNTQPTSPSFSWTTISNQQRGWVRLQKERTYFALVVVNTLIFPFFWMPVPFSPTTFKEICLGHLEDRPVQEFAENSFQPFPCLRIQIASED